MHSKLTESKNLFSTPFWQFKMEENFRIQLLNFFSSHFDFNNLPSEYDDYNLFTEKPDSPELKMLRAEAKSLVVAGLGKQYLEMLSSNRAWLCGSGPNYSMKSHNHANSSISFVFYFQAKESGDLIFHDPRANANRGYSFELQQAFHLKDIQWTPASGDIIMFPSFLYHSVLSGRSHTNRIAVALDFFTEA